MPREKPTYRDNLDRLGAEFPDKEVLRYADIAKYLNLSLPTVKRNFYKDYNPKIHGISKTVLASILS
jgi:hypothetical protein